MGGKGEGEAMGAEIHLILAPMPLTGEGGGGDDLPPCREQGII